MMAILDYMQRTGVVVWFESSRSWPVDREADFGGTLLVPLLVSEVPFDYVREFPGVVFLWDRCTRTAVATTIGEAQVRLTGIGHPDSLMALDLEMEEDIHVVTEVFDELQGSVGVPGLPLEHTHVDSDGIVEACKVEKLLTLGEMREATSLHLPTEMVGEVVNTCTEEVSWVNGWHLDSGLRLAVGYVSVGSASTSAGQIPLSGCFEGSIVCWPEALGSSEFRLYSISAPTILMPMVFGLAKVMVYEFSLAEHEGIPYMSPGSRMVSQGNLVRLLTKLVSESVDGYCYLGLFEDSHRTEAILQLGRWPALARLLAVDRSWFRSDAVQRVEATLVDQGWQGGPGQLHIEVGETGCEVSDFLKVGKTLPLQTIVGGLNTDVVDTSWLTRAKLIGDEEHVQMVEFPPDVVKGLKTYVLSGSPHWPFRVALMASDDGIARWWCPVPPGGTTVVANTFITLHVVSGAINSTVGVSLPVANPFSVKGLSRLHCWNIFGTLKHAFRSVGMERLPAARVTFPELLFRLGIDSDVAKDEWGDVIVEVMRASSIRRADRKSKDLPCLHGK